MRLLFLDANVLFTAAHRPEGKAALVIFLAAEGHWKVCTSDLAEEEARRNLERKFATCLPELDKLLKELDQIPNGDGQSCPISLPAKDRPILESALRAGATHLLTGDVKDFGPYMDAPEHSNGILIQTVSTFLADRLKE